MDQSVEIDRDEARALLVVIEWTYDRASEELHESRGRPAYDEDAGVFRPEGAGLPAYHRALRFGALALCHQIGDVLRGRRGAWKTEPLRPMPLAHGVAAALTQFVFGYLEAEAAEIERATREGVKAALEEVAQFSDEQRARLRETLKSEWSERQPMLRRLLRKLEQQH